MQAKVEGVFQQFSIFIVGGSLALLALYFDSIHYTYLVFFIFVGYAYVVIKLHHEYQETLKKTLAAQKGQETKDVKTAFSVAETLNDELKADSEKRVIYSLKLMEKIEPVMLESVLLNFSGNRNQEIRKYVLGRINDLKIHAALNSVKKISEADDSPVIKNLAQQAVQYLKETENIPLSGPRLAQLVKSRSKQEREDAAKALGRTNGDDESTLHLLLLMRDVDPDVRMSAILSVGKSGNVELWPLLIDQLSSSIFGNAAAAVVASFGERVMPSLEAAFHKTGQTEQTQLRIIQIYGRIGGAKAIELLWAKIDFPNKKIRSQIFLSLSNCEFKVDNEKLVKIKQSLETAIGNAAWNVAALSEIGDDETRGPIREALKEEYEHDRDLIFLLLSFMYDTKSIRLVKENLDSGTAEGALYGIELLDVFLEDDVQPLLFPLLEDISQEERTERLQTHFPREELDSTQVLIHIINRDYNYVNRWTKACAIFSLAVTPDYKVTDDLIANLFNPDPLLRETSAWVIHYLDKKVYHEATQRLVPAVKKELDEKIATSGKQIELRIERIIRLKQTRGFTKVPGTILADLEETIEVEEYRKGQTLISKGDNGNCPIFVVAEGEIGLFDNNELISSMKEKELVGEKIILDSDVNTFSVIAVENSKVYRIEKVKFFELMSNNYELAKEFIHVVASEWSKVEENEEEAVNS